jgi:translation initiation factor 2B subunit (eIF-2B alpha/beta/delta family)
MKVTVTSREYKMITLVARNGEAKIPEFLVTCRVADLTDEEQNLISKYKEYTDTFAIVGGYSVRSLMRGVTFSYQDVNSALDCEAMVEASCQQFIDRLRKMNLFSKRD